MDTETGTDMQNFGPNSMQTPGSEMQDISQMGYTAAAHPRSTTNRVLEDHETSTTAVDVDIEPFSDIRATFQPEEQQKFWAKSCQSVIFVRRASGSLQQKLPIDEPHIDLMSAMQ
jgi:hypothetical protein